MTGTGPAGGDRERQLGCGTPHRRFAGNRAAPCRRCLRRWAEVQANLLLQEICAGAVGDQADGIAGEGQARLRRMGRRLSRSGRMLARVASGQ